MISTILLASALTTSVVLSATPFSNPKVIQSIYEYPGKCIGVDSSLVATMYDCDGEDDQLWTYDGDKLQNLDYPDLCLTANSDSSPSLQHCTGAPDQSWVVSDDSEIFLRPSKWIEITGGNYIGAYPVNTELSLYDDVDNNNGRFTVEGTLQERGCGSGGASSFAVFFGDVEGQKWHSIEYTMEFVSGASSCVSMMGNTHYGHFTLDTIGLYEFDVADGDVIVSNDLSFGEWNGETKICNNKDSNFLHVKHGKGYKGSVRVQQRRDMTEWRAGIASGFSCTEPGTIVRYKDIKVAIVDYENDDNKDLTVSCLVDTGMKLINEDCGGDTPFARWRWAIVDEPM